jgi:D-alanyl-D-alanine carboxypeptidase/D-alanyl-D-alanine-endopeptidase (penicillin-binding protein 4)
MKLLTTTAALESLGPDATFTTRVVDGAKPRDIVLVGGGDPYLARKPGGHASYPKVADVTTLAGKTAAALKADGRTTVRVQYDDHLFTGPKASPTWPATYADVTAPMSALWVDQGTTPGQYGFDQDPAASAADAFVTALKAAGIKVKGTPKRVKAGESADLASVESPPLWQIVERVLAISDNEGADVLSHQVGLAEGFGGSFEGGARGVRKVLNGLDVDLSGAVIHDGSGLSRRDRLRPETLLDVLTHAADTDRPELRAVITGLPVAGFSGSLAFRFDKGAPAGRGRVRAKTGTLTGVHGLAGVTTDKQGNLMSFVLIADKVKLEDTLDARATLDQMAAALGACRCG